MSQNKQKSLDVSYACVLSIVEQTFAVTPVIRILPVSLPSARLSFLRIHMTKTIFPFSTLIK